MLKTILITTLLTSCSTVKQNSVSNFEEGKVDKVWKLKKLTKDGWQVQKKIVHTGDYAMKFTLKKGMKIGTGNNGQITERIELKERDQFHAYLDEEHIYKFSMYIPKNFPIINKRLVIGQWKQMGVHSPLIAQRFVNGIFYVTISNTSGKKVILKLSKKQSLSIMGKWITVKYGTKFSNLDGYVRLEIAEYKARYEGPLGFPNDGRNIYFKFGLYRDQVSTPMTIYFDDYEHIKL